MLWETVSNILLKSKETKSTAFLSFSKQITVIEGDVVNQAGPAFHNPILTSVHVIVLYMLSNGTRSVPWHRGQIDRPVIPQTFLLTPLAAFANLQSLWRLANRNLPC